MNRARAILAGLGRAGSPGRTVSVGVTAAVLAVKAGDTAVTVLALVVAVLSGQLLAGWAQDRLRYADDRFTGDRSTDERSTGRANAAPVAGTASLGAASLGALEIGIFAAFVVTGFASLLLGWRAGLAQLAIVAATFGGTWHRGRTAVGWPFTVAAAALLPAVATLALPSPVWPAWWATTAGALVGAAVGCTDAVGAAARRTPPTAEPGIGRRATGLTRVPWPHGVLVPGAALLFAAVSALLGFAPAHAPDPITVIGSIVAVVLIGAGARELWSEPDRRATFFSVVTLGPIFLVMVISAGGTLH